MDPRKGGRNYRSDENKRWLQFDVPAEEFELMLREIIKVKLVGVIHGSCLQTVELVVYGSAVGLGIHLAPLDFDPIPAPNGAR